MYYKCTKLSCAGKGIFKNNIFNVSKQCSALACLESLSKIFSPASFETITNPEIYIDIDVALASKNQPSVELVFVVSSDDEERPDIPLPLHGKTNDELATKSSNDETLCVHVSYQLIWLENHQMMKHHTVLKKMFHFT
ncbi:uncharacterized protein LOC135926821 [Gordionus sp. m RMFG-2023]|uniref:uncharacterized protein LOC135926821 n=1 Tax=Gordionus sp. m RMFG-2023 TaxID=3053472 RepID=UPI0031FC88D2